MAGTTTNRANRYPSGADPANVPSDVQNLATDLDNVANIYTGTLAARPTAVATAGHAAANPGSFYYATDTGELFVNIAGTWIKVTTEPGVPIGAMIPTGATGDPADTRFLLADGRALARTGQYALLFAAIGTSYGAGDGSTTFNIPDRRGRTSVGADNMGTAQGAAGRLPNSNRALGQNGGEERHVLITAELAAHAHTMQSAGSHSHGGGTGASDLSHSHITDDGTQNLLKGGVTGTGNFSSWSNPTGSGVKHQIWEIPNTSVAGLNHSHGIGTDGAHTHTVDSNGSGTAHNNLQPYQVDNWLVRVK
jgi:microcystin-dependent protein